MCFEAIYMSVATCHSSMAAKKVSMFMKLGLSWGDHTVRRAGYELQYYFTA